MTEQASKPERYIREPECRERSGLGRVTRWRLEQRGHFPKRRQISPNGKGWLESEFETWQADPEGWAREHGVTQTGEAA